SIEQGGWTIGKARRASNPTPLFASSFNSAPGNQPQDVELTGGPAFHFQSPVRLAEFQTQPSFGNGPGPAARAFKGRSERYRVSIRALSERLLRRNNHAQHRSIAPRPGH